MGAGVQGFRGQAQAQAEELLQAIATAESLIVATIERECEALRAGRMLAANALRLRLRDAAKLYLSVVRAARASIWTIEQLLPGTDQHLQECRAAFAALLKVELAVLAAERAAVKASDPVDEAKPPVARPDSIRALRRRRSLVRRVV